MGCGEFALETSYHIAIADIYMKYAKSSIPLRMHCRIMNAEIKPKTR
jgi:hypothetical protein